jgi:hypothetical protein
MHSLFSSDSSSCFDLEFVFVKIYFGNTISKFDAGRKQKNPTLS